MQNKQALIKVAEWLEDGAQHVNIDNGHKIDKFDMEYGVTNNGCGTACCIAGAIVQFEGLIRPVLSGSAVFFDEVDDETNEVVEGVCTLATNHLGIDKDTAAQLFVPWEYFNHNSCSEFSDPDRAAQVVRHYLETGVVDWDMFPASEESSIVSKEPATGWLMRSLPHVLNDLQNAKNEVEFLDKRFKALASKLGIE
ncbi:hypothetical protein vB_PsyM_KIL3b_0136 [Pseudomonas phage vB_PsyM_KIL3b]|uniref:Uncharacterized protein n=5 Tax=Pseudomonas phage vB_PsyM_KIL1 TaxID=1777065 RepID=A0A142IE88_9CAUD|nr:hypothetical protein BH774_gp067 [Pseudomonas phage vB_PsyM_KIL1]AMR57543.1 hypothetical protein vB_PsyM_KIL2_0143 [Pseudomonas phage vB_PsyM_KIL2]AMR57703.1 hypothetical protein vB_PsyM_KIL3_0136 [Pseudomonas phage vB_PsyM_KIL3]AMR58034.1 hypothetical protein vB_PsyM_KIL5_0143 [Pseudomonas phage vB_PsyM_KIL5]AMR58201.1 hypothetical protein vB_PsyM_KIL3b_0136 [Pseudomonas phage vB_PsyM_KIL3b]AMR57382.1 hypothetical protein vB_PsyM_KIL1_0135 [Pseudomonas phage vB_PsyM_KIL1]